MQSDVAVRSGLGWNWRALVLESIIRIPSHFPNKGQSAGTEPAFITVTAVRKVGWAGVESWVVMGIPRISIYSKYACPVPGTLNSIKHSDGFAPVGARYGP